MITHRSPAPSLITSLHLSIDWPCIIHESSQPDAIRALCWWWSGGYRQLTATFSGKGKLAISVRYYIAGIRVTTILDDVALRIREVDEEAILVDTSAHVSGCSG